MAGRPHKKGLLSAQIGLELHNNVSSYCFTCMYVTSLQFLLQESIILWVEFWGYNAYTNILKTAVDSDSFETCASESTFH